MRIDFTGKVVLITGASRGIGRATAKLFAEHGAKLAVHYNLDQEAAESLVHELGERGTTARSYKAAMAEQDKVAEMVGAVVQNLGGIDVVVNNAGIWKRAPLDTMTAADLEQMLEVNLQGQFYCAQAAIRRMDRKHGGAIVNIASTAGQRGEAFHSHYAASKGATIAATKSWATELASRHIRVNCVAPGWVSTDMSAAALDADSDRAIRRLIPLGRPAEPEEIAGAIVFAASEWASFMTGEVINVNGGAVLCG